VLLAVGVVGFVLVASGVVVRVMRDGQLGYALAIGGLTATLSAALVFLALLVDRWDTR